jgi:hypothetical protein
LSRSTAVSSSTIDFVFTPTAGENLYYNTKYQIKYQASNGVNFVNISLYKQYPLDPSYIYWIQDIALWAPTLASGTGPSPYVIFFV